MWRLVQDRLDRGRRPRPRHPEQLRHHHRPAVRHDLTCRATHAATVTVTKTTTTTTTLGSAASINNYLTDDPTALEHGYVPLINGSNTNFSHPFVLTYPSNGYPTDKPRPQLYTSNLTGFSKGAGPIGVREREPAVWRRLRRPRP